MTDDSERALYKIAAELQKEIRDLKHDDDSIHVALVDINKRLDDINKMSLYDFIHKVEGNTFEEINKRLITIENFIGQNYRSDVKTLQDHKNRQIDENRAISRKLDELESMTKSRDDFCSDHESRLITLENMIKSIFNLLAK